MLGRAMAKAAKIVDLEPRSKWEFASMELKKNAKVPTHKDTPQKELLPARRLAQL